MIPHSLMHYGRNVGAINCRVSCNCQNIERKGSFTLPLFKSIMHASKSKHGHTIQILWHVKSSVISQKLYLTAVLNYCLTVIWREIRTFWTVFIQTNNLSWVGNPTAFYILRTLDGGHLYHAYFKIALK